MVENKLNLKFFPQFPIYNYIDNGRWYEFKIPHAVQLKDVVLHVDYTDLTSTIKAAVSMKNVFNECNLPKDFNELIERLSKYKFDFEYHPYIYSLRMFDRIEVKSENLNCLVYYPQFTELTKNNITLDKILSLPPETIIYNTEIKIVRNSKYYKPNELYISVDNLYYDDDEPEFDKLSESEKYKKYPRGNVYTINKNYKHYKTNDVLTLLSLNTYINTELSQDIKEIYLVYKDEIICKEDVNKCLGNIKVYIDYKLTDITTLTELFDYLKKHKTTCVNILFKDTLLGENFEGYRIYYKAIMN